MGEALCHSNGEPSEGAGGVVGILRGYRLKMCTCVTRRQSSCSCSCASSAARRDSSSASLQALDPDLRHTRNVSSLSSEPEMILAMLILTSPCPFSLSYPFSSSCARARGRLQGCRARCASTFCSCVASSARRPLCRPPRGSAISKATRR